MSLLPIIYSSILIFSGILVFVVIVSFVSFKTKTEKDYISEQNKERDISEPAVNRQKNVFEKESENKFKINRESGLHSKKINTAAQEDEREYRRRAKKHNEENISVLYKKKELFSRNRPKFKEPRFIVIKNISEHLVNNDSTVEIESASYHTVHMIEISAVDYLKFYENY
jgi:hypothetical protein